MEMTSSSLSYKIDLVQGAVTSIDTVMVCSNLKSLWLRFKTKQTEDLLDQY